PEGLHGGDGGHERGVVPAEGAVVLTRLPDVEVGAEEDDGQGLPGAAERLGEADDVGFQTHLLEGEEGAGAPAADLDVVDDDEDAVLLAHLEEAAQPRFRGDVDATFGLDRLEDDRGRWFDTGAVIDDETVEVIDGVGF